MPTIKLDRDRTLKYSIASSIAFKRQYGKGLKAALYGEMSDLTTDDDCLRYALWAGLIHEDTRLTPDRVTELLQEHLDAGGDVIALIELVSDAMLDSGLLGVRKVVAGKEKAGTS